MPDQRNKRKTRIGVVVSNKMDSSCVVKVVTSGPHPFFRKVVKKNKKLYVHDEKKAARVGDEVLVMETRPLSRLKRWRLVKILKRNESVLKPIEDLEETQK